MVELVPKHGLHVDPLLDCNKSSEVFPLGAWKVCASRSNARCVLNSSQESLMRSLDTSVTDASLASENDAQESSSLAMATAARTPEYTDNG